MEFKCPHPWKCPYLSNYLRNGMLISTLCCINESISIILKTIVFLGRWIAVIAYSGIGISSSRPRVNQGKFRKWDLCEFDVIWSMGTGKKVSQSIEKWCLPILDNWWLDIGTIMASLRFVHGDRNGDGENIVPEIDILSQNSVQSFIELCFWQSRRHGVQMPLQWKMPSF